MVHGTALDPLAQLFKLRITVAFVFCALVHACDRDACDGVTFVCC